MDRELFLTTVWKDAGGTRSIQPAGSGSYYVDHQEWRHGLHAGFADLAFTFHGVCVVKTFLHITMNRGLLPVARYAMMAYVWRIQDCFPHRCFLLCVLLWRERRKQNAPTLATLLKTRNVGISGTSLLGSTLNTADEPRRNTEGPGEIPRS